MDLKKCRIKNKFEFIQYTEENKSQFTQQLRAHGYALVTIENAPLDVVMFCKFDRDKKVLKSEIEVVSPGQYMVFYDDDSHAIQTQEEFDASFELVKEDE